MHTWVFLYRGEERNFSLNREIVGIVGVGGGRIVSAVTTQICLVELKPAQTVREGKDEGSPNTMAAGCAGPEGLGLLIPSMS